MYATCDLSQDLDCKVLKSILGLETIEVYILGV